MPARVIGFSTGKSDNSKVSAFHTVAEYNGRDGRKFYVEGSVGSSVPFHAVGDTVTVLVDPTEPAKALLESRISFILGGVLALMGLFSFVMFGVTFQPTLFYVAMAAFIIGGLVVKGRTLRREKPSFDGGLARVQEKRTVHPGVHRRNQRPELNLWVWALLSLLGVMFLILGFHAARRRLRAGKSF